MAQHNIEKFWDFSDDQLKHYTTLFNDNMGPKGFQVEYKIVDKMPIGVIYVLMMHYKEYTAHRGDVLLYFYVCSTRSHYKPEGTPS